MVTIKKKQIIFKDERLLKEYSNIVRYTYNRKLDGVTKQSVLEQAVKDNMNNISNLDASFIKCAVQKGLMIENQDKLIFGGKSNFNKRKYNKIDKEEFNSKRYNDIWVRGSSNDGGNRKFSLEINTRVDSYINFKPKKGTKYQIPLKLSKNEFNILKYITINKLPFTASIDLDNVFIAYDEKLINIDRPYKPIKDRIMSFDLNPNYIGIVIKDYNTDNIIHEGVISSYGHHELSTTKKKVIIYDSVKKLIDLAKHYRIDYMVFEDLTISAKNHGKGMVFNKVVNTWDRNTLINNLIKNLNLSKIKYESVPSYYSSFIGAVENPEKYDMVAAALEIGKRFYLSKKENKDYWSIINRDYEGLPSYLQSTRWKKMVEDITIGDNLVDFYRTIKETKWRHSYRLVFDPSMEGINCFKLNHIDCLRYHLL